MSTKVANGRESLGRHVIFNNGSDIFIILTGLHKLTRLDPTIVRGLQQFLAGIVYVSGHKHFAAIPVVSIDVDGDIEIDDIAVLQGSIVGDAVTNDFVDAGTTTFGETVIVEGGRVGSAL